MTVDDVKFACRHLRGELERLVAGRIHQENGAEKIVVRTAPFDAEAAGVNQIFKQMLRLVPTPRIWALKDRDIQKVGAGKKLAMLRDAVGYTDNGTFISSRS